MAGTNTSTVEELCRRGHDLLAAGQPTESARAYRAAIDEGESQASGSKTASLTAAMIEAHHGLVRALRQAGRLEQSIGAALALTALTPNDPQAHAALAESLQLAGHAPQAEAAAVRARLLEWKIQLKSPPESSRIEVRKP